MRILLISHFFPPQRVGGAEKISLVYANNLQQRGHQVQVLCAGEWEEWEPGQHHYNGYVDETYQGIAVRKVNLNWAKAQDPNRSLYDNPLVEANYEKWIEEWKPDVVHIVSLLTLSASIVRATKKYRIPIIFTMVDFWLVCPKVNLVRGDQTLCDGKVTAKECLKCLLWDTKIYQNMLRIVPEETAVSAFGMVSHQPRISKIRGLRGKAMDIDARRLVMAEVAEQVDCFIAPSVFLKNVTQEAGLQHKQVRLIHYGHDLSWLETMPPKTSSNSVRIGYIGQIIPLKGLHILIPAFLSASRKAASQGIQAELLIYGDPQSNPAYTAKLMEMIGENPHVQFMGAYSHAQIGEVLSQLDVNIVPSQWHENNPLVVQEAFASKTPVIGSNVGGISEFIRHDVNGLLFEYSSVEDLQAQMERVLTEAGLIDRLASGIGPVKTIAEEIDEIIEIYKTLVPQRT